MQHVFSIILFLDLYDFCMKSLFFLIVNFYKYLFSPFLLTSCRFYPTCSIYFMDTINKYTVQFALYLIVKRICKCNKFFKGGYDSIL